MMADARTLILATVIDVNGATVSYPGCNVCHTKLQENASTSNDFVCHKCRRSYGASEVSHRYRVSLRVAADQTECDVTVFGSCLEKIFGATANRFTQFQVHLKNHGVPPTEVEDLVHQAAQECLIGQKYYFGFRVPRRAETLTLKYVMETAPPCGVVAYQVMTRGIQDSVYQHLKKLSAQLLQSETVLTSQMEKSDSKTMKPCEQLFNQSNLGQNSTVDSSGLEFSHVSNVNYSHQQISLGLDSLEFSASVSSQEMSSSDVSCDKLGSTPLNSRSPSKSYGSSPPVLNSSGSKLTTNKGSVLRGSVPKESCQKSNSSGSKFTTNKGSALRGSVPKETCQKSQSRTRKSSSVPCVPILSNSFKNSVKRPKKSKDSCSNDFREEVSFEHFREDLLSAASLVTSPKKLHSNSIGLKDSCSQFAGERGSNYKAKNDASRSKESLKERNLKGRGKRVSSGKQNSSEQNSSDDLVRKSQKNKSKTNFRRLEFEKEKSQCFNLSNKLASKRNDSNCREKTPKSGNPVLRNFGRRTSGKTKNEKSTDFHHEFSRNEPQSDKFEKVDSNSFCMWDLLNDCSGYEVMSDDEQFQDFAKQKVHEKVPEIVLPESENLDDFLQKFENSEVAFCAESRCTVPVKDRSQNKNLLHVPLGVCRQSSSQAHTHSLKSNTCTCIGTRKTLGTGDFNKRDTVSSSNQKRSVVKVGSDEASSNCREQQSSPGKSVSGCAELWPPESENLQAFLDMLNERENTSHDNENFIVNEKRSRTKSKEICDMSEPRKEVISGNLQRTSFNAQTSVLGTEVCRKSAEMDLATVGKRLEEVVRGHARKKKVKSTSVCGRQSIGRKNEKCSHNHMPASSKRVHKSWPVANKTLEALPTCEDFMRAVEGGCSTDAAEGHSVCNSSFQDDEFLQEVFAIEDEMVVCDEQGISSENGEGVERNATEVVSNSGLGLEVAARGKSACEDMNKTGTAKQDDLSNFEVSLQGGDLNSDISSCEGREMRTTPNRKAASQDLSALHVETKRSVHRPDFLAFDKEIGEKHAVRPQKELSSFHMNLEENDLTEEEDSVLDVSCDLFSQSSFCEMEASFSLLKNAGTTVAGGAADSGLGKSSLSLEHFERPNTGNVCCDEVFEIAQNADKEGNFQSSKSSSAESVTLYKGFGNLSLEKLCTAESAGKVEIAQNMNVERNLNAAPGVTPNSIKGEGTCMPPTPCTAESAGKEVDVTHDKVVNASDSLCSMKKILGSSKANVLTDCCTRRNTSVHEELCADKPRCGKERQTAESLRKGKKNYSPYEKSSVGPCDPRVQDSKCSHSTPGSNISNGNKNCEELVSVDEDLIGPGNLYIQDSKCSHSIESAPRSKNYNRRKDSEEPVSQDTGEQNMFSQDLFSQDLFASQTFESPLIIPQTPRNAEPVFRKTRKISKRGSQEKGSLPSSLNNMSKNQQSGGKNKVGSPKILFETPLTCRSFARRRCSSSKSKREPGDLTCTCSEFTCTCTGSQDLFSQDLFASQTFKSPTVVSNTPRKAEHCRGVFRGAQNLNSNARGASIEKGSLHSSLGNVSDNSQICGKSKNSPQVLFKTPITCRSFTRRLLSTAKSRRPSTRPSDLVSCTSTPVDSGKAESDLLPSSNMPKEVFRSAADFEMKGADVGNSGRKFLPTCKRSVVPSPKSGGCRKSLKRCEESEDKMKHFEGAMGRTMNFEETEDKMKTFQETEDRMKSCEETEDKMKCCDGTEDKMKCCEETENNMKSCEGTEDKMKSCEGTENKMKSCEGTEDKMKSFEFEETEDKMRSCEPNRLLPTCTSCTRQREDESHKLSAQFDLEAEKENMLSDSILLATDAGVCPTPKSAVKSDNYDFSPDLFSDSMDSQFFSRSVKSAKRQSYLFTPRNFRGISGSERLYSNQFEEFVPNDDLPSLSFDVSGDLFSD